MRTRAWSTLLIVVATTGCAGAGSGASLTASTPTSSSSSPPAPSTAQSGSASPAPATKTIATGLPVPWGLAFLPDGTALVTLRDRAEVMHVAEGAAPVPLGRLPGVVPATEGGLLGIAVSPAFASDRSVFVYLTSADDNRVMRMTFDGAVLRPGPVIVQGIAKARNHNGGRLAFGPDRFLYISTGDRNSATPPRTGGR